MNESLSTNGVMDSPLKLAILRVLTSYRDFKGTGREIAKLTGYSAPSTHETLKNLYDTEVLNREIIGRQHIYSLNEKSRIVMKIIRPMFQVENGYKEEIRDFLVEELKKNRIKNTIVSLILYGSVQQNKAKAKSDIDIAVVVKKVVDIKKVEDCFLSTISSSFKEYFGVQLDPYIKSAGEFRSRLKKNQSPLSNLVKSYTVLYGKEPLEV